MANNKIRGSNGMYNVSGRSFSMLIGTRAQVWHGTAYKTSGGLIKSDLMQNKAGRIVSKAKHSTAKREMRLVKAGYGTKKGKFGFVKLGRKSRSRKHRGGYKSPIQTHIGGSPGPIGQMPSNPAPVGQMPSDKMSMGGSRRTRRVKGGNRFAARAAVGAPGTPAMRRAYFGGSGMKPLGSGPLSGEVDNAEFGPGNWAGDRY